MEKDLSFSEICFIGRRGSLVTGIFVVKIMFYQTFGASVVHSGAVFLRSLVSCHTPSSIFLAFRSHERVGVGILSFYEAR